MREKYDKEKKLILTALTLKVAATILALLFFYGKSHGSTIEEPHSDRYTRITLTIEDEQELFPDILNLNISLIAKANREADVINILGSLDRSIRELNLNYSGGTYHASKNCRWERDRLRCVGYTGEVNYIFKLKAPDEQNRILEVIDRFKDRYGEKVSYTVSGPFWTVDKDRQKQAIDTLRTEIIKKARSVAAETGSILGSHCRISRIDFTRIGSPHMPYYSVKTMEATTMETISAPEPKAEKQIIKEEARIELECK